MTSAKLIVQVLVDLIEVHCLRDVSDITGNFMKKEHTPVLALLSLAREATCCHGQATKWPISWNEKRSRRKVVETMKRPEVMGLYVVPKPPWCKWDTRTIERAVLSKLRKIHHKKKDETYYSISCIRPGAGRAWKVVILSDLFC